MPDDESKVQAGPRKRRRRPSLPIDNRAAAGPRNEPSEAAIRRNGGTMKRGGEDLG